MDRECQDLLASELNPSNILIKLSELNVRYTEHLLSIAQHNNTEAIDFKGEMYDLLGVQDTN